LDGPAVFYAFALLTDFGSSSHICRALVKSGNSITVAGFSSSGSVPDCLRGIEADHFSHARWCRMAVVNNLLRAHLFW